MFLRKPRYTARRVEEHAVETFWRKPETRRHFKVGATKFAEDIAPRLDKVYIGPRTIAFTGTSVARVTQEIIDESTAVAAAKPPIPTNAKRKAQRRLAEDA
jgi:hypothetical protein